MKWLSLFGGKLYAIGGIVLAAMAGVFRYRQVKEQRDNAREDRDRLEEQIRQREVFDDIDEELDDEFDEREREALDDIEDGEMPDSIRDRNSF